MSVPSTGKTSESYVLLRGIDNLKDNRHTIIPAYEGFPIGTQHGVEAPLYILDTKVSTECVTL
eukprot:SAG11_NODE_8244_length_1041_cov_1.990446_3_plen_62_part_01